jgi:hypothetical protein
MPTLKLVSWNIFRIGSTKLRRELTSFYPACGLGNTVLDYMTKFITADAVWNNGVPGVPADIIIIIELISGTQNKGQPATGSALRTQAALVTGFNNAIEARGLQAQYVYAGTAQQNISPRESMSIIYNTVVLNNTDARALRDNVGGWLGPRTPFLARFTTVNAPHTPLNIIGIHAPPKDKKNGSADNSYTLQLAYADALATIPVISDHLETVIIAGDYNCSTCSKRKVQVVEEGEERARTIRAFGFKDLTDLGYTTLIPDPMFQFEPPEEIYSSVRERVDNEYLPPYNYLSEAYDTALYNLTPDVTNPVQAVNNLIGTARNTIGPIQRGVTEIPLGALYPGEVNTLLDQYNKVSDHFPITMLFNYPDPPDPNL